METKTATRAFLTTLMILLVFCSSCSNDDSNKPDPAKRDTDIEAEGKVVQAIEDALVPICDENGASKSSGIWVYDIFGNYLITPSDAMTDNKYYVMDGDNVAEIDVDSIVNRMDYYIVARIDSAGISVLQDRFLPIEAYYERAGGLKKLLDEDDLWLFGLARLSAPQDQATQISEWVNPWFQVNASRKKYLGTHLVLEYYDSAVNVLGLCTVTQSDDNGQNDAAIVWKITY